MNIDFEEHSMPSNSDDDRSYDEMDNELNDLRQSYNEAKGLIMHGNKDLMDPNNFDSILDRKNSLPRNLRTSF